MPDPTPGQVNYVAFKAALPDRAYSPAPAWDTVSVVYQRAWEAAAQAVQSDVRRYVRAVIRHWHACGPGYGFAEPLHALETWLEAQQPQEDTPDA